MKYTINGLDQETVVKYGLKVADTVIIKWARDIFGLRSAFRQVKDGKPFYWLKVDQLLQDYPVLDIKKDTILRKLKSYGKDHGLLEYFSETTPAGHFTYFSPTEKFEEFFRNSHSEKNSSENTESKKFSNQLKNNSTGSKNNSTGSNENSTIPYKPNTLKNNTSSPKSPPEELQKVENTPPEEKEEEVIFEWLKNILSFCKDEKRLRSLAKKHGAYSMKKIYAGVRRDINNGTLNGVGAFLKRLENNDRIEPKKERKRVYDTQRETRGQHINEDEDIKNALESGILSNSLKQKDEK